jgi:hypothetical protein
MYELRKPIYGPTLLGMDSIHDYVLDRLSATKGSWPKVAKSAGVSYRTLKKIATKTTVSPGIKNLERLASYFRDSERAA